MPEYTEIADLRGEIAELRHGDAAERQRRRIVAEPDALENAEDVARCERARRRGDQRVHLESRHACHSRPCLVRA